MGGLAKKHEKAGWWLLVLFVGGGLVLEAFHGLKIGSYLDPSNSLRRELWRLGHAHGAVIALVHLGFAAYLRPREGWTQAPIASVCVLLGSILVPLGFFLGGVSPSEGDPAVGIWLVPLGGLALLSGCVLTAIHATRGGEPTA